MNNEEKINNLEKQVAEIKSELEQYKGINNPDDFVIENGVLKRYKGSDECIMIPDCVTEIGKRAFFGCESIKAVYIHDLVTKIDDMAFSLCRNLVIVYIPETVMKIGNFAFFQCDNLEIAIHTDCNCKINAFSGCKNVIVY